MDTEQPTKTLTEQLHEHVDRWVIVTAPRLRRDVDHATITITMLNPSDDGDGTLAVDFQVEEETSFSSEHHGSARVPGIAY